MMRRMWTVSFVFWIIYFDNYGCINCIGYYGSYLGIQDKYKISVEDDLEYLYNSDFFKENINDLFHWERRLRRRRRYGVMRVSRNRKPKIMICDGDGDGDLIDAICIKTDEPVPISVTVSSGKRWGLRRRNDVIYERLTWKRAIRRRRRRQRRWYEGDDDTDDDTDDSNSDNSDSDKNQRQIRR
jgi:hypothetical protein